MKLSEEKSKALQLRMSNTRHQYMLQAAQLENNFAETAVGVLVDTRLYMNQQCAFAARRQGLMVSRAT